MDPITNGYGFTFLRWARAAGFTVTGLSAGEHAVGFTVTGLSAGEHAVLYSAWNQGVDPTEYRNGAETRVPEDVVTTTNTVTLNIETATMSAEDFISRGVIIAAKPRRELKDNIPIDIETCKMDFDRAKPPYEPELNELHKDLDDAVRCVKLADAIESCIGESSLCIKYTKCNGEISERVITPLVMLHPKGHAAVQAWCHLRDQMRTFYVHRIGMMDPVELQALDYKAVFRGLLQARSRGF